jgi:hypothetical protein
MADDPVKLGFVRSLSRPEGDIAGVVLVASESPRSGSSKGVRSMASESTQEIRMRDQVFISYSHQDAEWMKKFSAQLKLIQRTGCLDIWSDERIKSGQNWQQEIDAAIAKARVALLLATPDFFASEFIQNEELPKILKRHQEKGLFLYWVPIRHGAYPKSYLVNIQAASDPKQPLRDLSEADQDRIMSQIALDIGEKLGQSVRVVSDARQQLMENALGVAGDAAGGGRVCWRSLARRRACRSSGNG